MWKQVNSEKWYLINALDHTKEPLGMGMVWERIGNWFGLEISTDRIFGKSMMNTMYIYIYIQTKLHVYCLMLALLASNVISDCMAVLLSCNLYIIFWYASVAGKQAILACMPALLTSNAISACMPALLASKLYGLVCQRCWQAMPYLLVCQRCWQASYMGLYASVAGKQDIVPCMPALLASKLYGLVCQRCCKQILWLVCQRCWQASHMCLYAHITSNIIQTSVVVLSSICTYIYIYLFIYECILVNVVAFYFVSIVSWDYSIICSYIYIYFM